MPRDTYAASARSHILEEYAHFASQVCQAATSTRLYLSTAMIEARCDGPENYEDFEAHLDSMLRDVFGRRLNEMRRRFDEDGGDVSRLPWPLDVIVVPLHVAG